MIEFNSENNVTRKDAREMTLEEESKAISIINDLLYKTSNISPLPEVDLLQMFVDNYQKYQHYRHYTQGLWVSKEEELSKEEQEKHFQLSY